MGFIRRTLRWTLIVVVLVVALALALALIDGRTGGKSAAKQVAGQSQSDAIPLHVVGGVWDGWRLRVLRVAPNAFSFLGPDRQRIPPGGQEVMVSIA
jgi:hypothetical protein